MNDWNPFDGVDFYKVSAKKTLYQLDLEVKDRKPVIIPKVGDKVKIKSREWYEKWRDSEWDVPVLYRLTESMAKHCGRVLTVKGVNLGSRDWLFKLEEDEKEKNWSLEMFEEVYPQESSKEVECAKAFEALGVNASALEKQLTATSAFPAINSVQGIGISYDLGTLSRQGVGIETCPIPSPRITFPINGFGSTSAVVRQDLFKNKEPELQTIKKHRYIKLENL